jgi:alkylation response protein AidB-like acyl-CoA dehydrogenase
MANGDPETCEMFLDGVEVPVDQRVGQEGAGWQIAMTTVTYERGPGDVGFVAKFFKRLHAIEALVIESGRENDPELRKRLAAAFVRGETLRLNVLEQLSSRIAGHDAGVEGSISKQIFTEAIQDLEHLGLEIAGAEAMTNKRPEYLDAYLASRPASIYGGTSQVQRNIIARRLLGMPAR